MALLVGDGKRAPGCVIRGCANQVDRGKRLICDLHARLLADAAARKRGIPPAEFSHAEDDR